jgi:hypothetical protein
MASAKQTKIDEPDELAGRLLDALQQERVVPRFVDSYVVDHGRFGLQVHASRYRDLLGLLQREALLATTVRTLQEIRTEVPAKPTRKGRRATARAMSKKDAQTFRRKCLSALMRRQKWTAGDALDFQNDLQLYEELIARQGAARRGRKPFEAANHPFVDRCAFLLDSSFLEKARLAASRVLDDLEELAVQVAGKQ